MSYKDWKKKYYTRDELDSELDMYIKESADILIPEINKKRKIKNNVNNKEITYV